jgi:hypothetical protein
MMFSRSGPWTAALRPPPVPADVAFQESAQVAPGRFEPTDGDAENPLRLFAVAGQGLPRVATVTGHVRIVPRAGSRPIG